ncbi:MAG TPA: hypothetical protein VM734_01670 [Kofleriaceae bacterium]|jgi:hypothetical protein|nr:hypothetical protein [Kofleriaceae bacterium]
MADRPRSPHELVREIAQARDDLVTRLSLLERRVREKVDVPARARVVVARTRQQALDRAAITVDHVRTRPERYIIVGTVVGIAVVLLAGWLRGRRRR